MRGLLPVAMLAALSACRGSDARLQLSFPSDAGGPGCEQQTGLYCVNYLQFNLDDGEGFSTHCVKVTKELKNLCDVAKLADGSELFRIPQDRTVQIEVKGMRVYPATSCDVSAACAPKVVFSGSTGEVKVAEKAGGAIDLPIAMAEPCAGHEQFFPRINGQTCDTVCAGGKLVCDLGKDGCLCNFP